MRLQFRRADRQLRNLLSKVQEFFDTSHVTEHLLFHLYGKSVFLGSCQHELREGPRLLIRAKMLCRKFPYVNLWGEVDAQWFPLEIRERVIIRGDIQAGRPLVLELATLTVYGHRSGFLQRTATHLNHRWHHTAPGQQEADRQFRFALIAGFSSRHNLTTCEGI